MQDFKPHQNPKLDELKFTRSKQALWQHIQKNARPKRKFSWNFGFARLASVSVLTVIFAIASIALPNLNNLLRTPLANADYVLTVNPRRADEAPSFTLTVNKEVDLANIASQIAFFPAVDYEVEFVNDTQILIVLKEEKYDPELEYKIVLEDQEEEKSYEWAYSEVAHFEAKPIAMEENPSNMEENLTPIPLNESILEPEQNTLKPKKTQSICTTDYNLEELSDFHTVNEFEQSDLHEQVYHVQAAGTLTLYGVRNIVLVEKGGQVNDQGYKNQIFLREGATLLADTSSSEVFTIGSPEFKEQASQSEHTECEGFGLREIFEDLDQLSKEEELVEIENPIQIQELEEELEINLPTSIILNEEVFEYNPVEPLPVKPIPAEVDQKEAEIPYNPPSVEPEVVEEPVISLPDLTAVAIAMDPVTGFLKVKIENLSEVILGADQNAEIWITIGDEKLPQWIFQWLDLKEKKQLEQGSFIITFPVQVKEGQQIQICLDAKQEIKESEEGNNCYVGTL